MNNSIFENPFINITIFGGLIFFICGFILLKFPPKERNSLYGYRTKKSMMNEENWVLSQKFASKEMMKFGIFLSISSVLGLIIEVENLTKMFIGLIFLISTWIIISYKVERKLKNKI